MQIPDFVKENSNSLIVDVDDINAQLDYEQNTPHKNFCLKSNEMIDREGNVSNINKVEEFQYGEEEIKQDLLGGKTPILN